MGLRDFERDAAIVSAVLASIWGNATFRGWDDVWAAIGIHSFIAY